MLFVFFVSCIISRYNASFAHLILYQPGSSPVGLVDVASSPVSRGSSTPVRKVHSRKIMHRRSLNEFLSSSFSCRFSNIFMEILA